VPVLVTPTAVAPSTPVANAAPVAPVTPVSAPEVRAKEQSEKPKDLYTELLKYDELRKRGILTDAEVQAVKKKLLSE